MRSRIETTDERQAYAFSALAFLLFIFLVIVLPLLTGCSSVSQIRHAEANQTAAMSKVAKAAAKKDVAQKAVNGQVANLAAQVKFLLSLPETNKTVPVANQLLDAQLSLTGAPTDRESVLEQEVKELMASDEKNQATIARIQKEGAEKQAALDDANRQVAVAKTEVVKTTAKLYSAAELFASKADEWDGFIRDLWIVLFVAIGLTVLFLFIKFGTKAAEATTAVAAKVL